MNLLSSIGEVVCTVSEEVVVLLQPVFDESDCRHGVLMVSRRRVSIDVRSLKR